MEEKALTVTQISTYFKQIFDAEEMLFNVKVVGEISGLSVVRNVAYFVLKDENATMNCVMFGADDFSFSNGDNVVLVGTPKYYVKGGKLNFNVSKITKYGLGELYQKFLELKNELERKGYFDIDRKKQMPLNINKIGVVTSKEGAVLQDIINVRTRRNPSVNIVLYPVKVQGVNAEYEIANAISDFNKTDVDLIIVARGGGSLEDLQPFNTKIVADAIFDSTKFVLSAVGHETDYTICDFCSDLRAPTPSVAAELVCEDVSTKSEIFKKLISRLKNAIQNLYLEKHEDLISCVDDIKIIYSNLLKEKQQKFDNLISKYKSVIKFYVENLNHKFEIVNSNLNKLNPDTILKLGYAKLKNSNNKNITVKEVNIGDEILTELSDAIITSKVLNIKEK